MASSIPTAAVTVALAAGFGVAWRLGLWLAVVAMVATAVTLVACQRLGDLVVARRAATWALYAPQGTTPASHLERTLAADLATVAVGDTNVLDHSITRAHHTIADPWVRGLAVERLQLAKELLADGALPQPPPALEALAAPATRWTAVTATVGLTLAAGATRQHLLLVPLTLSMAVVAIGWGEVRRRDRLPSLLCQEASAPPPRGVILMPESAVVAALSSLTASRRRVLSGAMALVVHRRSPRRDLGLHRLTFARQCGCPPPGPTLTSAVVVWAVCAAGFVVALAVL